MKIPSIRTQFLFFSILFLFFTAVIYRVFVVDSINDLDFKLNKMDSTDEIRDLIFHYSSGMNDSLKNQIQNDGRKILDKEKQKQLAFSFYKRDLIRYSGFLLIALLGILLFFITYLITKPLDNLMRATILLARGKETLNIKKFPFSPINPLIISFNKMVNDLELSKNQLIKAEKELLWKEMARALAHEIKTPITPIKLTLDRMKSEFDNKSNLMDIFVPSYNVINEEISNLNRLATEFSQFARLPKSNIKQINILDLINDIKIGYLGTLNIDIQCAGEDVILSIDSFQFRQVFNNLFKNSLEANADHIQINIELENSATIISLSDNGNGINKSQLRSVFEPYFTLKRKGTGLGLAIIKQIIDQHNAEIKVESTEGIGTIFYILFKETK